MEPDRTGPLAALSRALLLAGPPSLSALRSWCGQGEEYRDFVLLVREYLADHEAEILAQLGVEAQVAAFAGHFQERYFPLPDPFRDGYVDEYTLLIAEVPIIRMGLDYDEYHMMPDNWRLGHLLLAALVEDPYEHYGGGARVALLEASAQDVPKDLLERTGKGYPRVTLHRHLDKTRFDGVALMADWIEGCTDNAFLDITEETPVDAPWDPETVGLLTRQWSEANTIQDRIHSLAEWLEEDPPARFRELLEFIESREDDEKGEGG